MGPPRMIFACPRSSSQIQGVHAALDAQVSRTPAAMHGRHSELDFSDASAYRQLTAPQVAARWPVGRLPPT